MKLTLKEFLETIADNELLSCHIDKKRPFFWDICDEDKNKVRMIFSILLTDEALDAAGRTEENIFISNFIKEVELSENYFLTDNNGVDVCLKDVELNLLSLTSNQKCVLKAGAVSLITNNYLIDNTMDEITINCSKWILQHRTSLEALMIKYGNEHNQPTDDKELDLEDPKNSHYWYLFKHLLLGFPNNTVSHDMFVDFYLMETDTFSSFVATEGDKMTIKDARAAAHYEGLTLLDWLNKFVD